MAGGQLQQNRGELQSLVDATHHQVTIQVIGLNDGTTFSFWAVWTWKANPAVLVEASATQVQPNGAFAHAKQLDITSESSVVTLVYPY